MTKCPQCGGVVPPSGGSKPRTYCSERCRIRQSEERRSLRRRLEEWVRAREGIAVGTLCIAEHGHRVTVEEVDERIAELEAELAGVRVALESNQGDPHGR